MGEALRIECILYFGRALGLSQRLDFLGSQKIIQDDEAVLLISLDFLMGEEGWGDGVHLVWLD